MNNKIKQMKKINLYFAFVSSILLLVSFGKPTDPETLLPDDVSGGYKIIKPFPTSGYAQDVLKNDNLLYVAQGEGGLMIIDISDPLNPITLSNTSEGVRGYSTKIAMKDSVVFLAAGTFGVTVLDVANPMEPIVTVSNLNMKPARNFYIMGDYMFTAISEQGVMVSEISFPTQPDIRGDIHTMGYAHGLVSTSDSSSLLVACGEMGLSIFDISTFDQGYGSYPQVGWGDTPGYAESIVIRESESLAFMACGTAGLQILDFSDTTHVNIIGSYDGGGYAKDLELSGDRIFMTAEERGLQIIDVSDVNHPKLAGTVDTPYALGLDMNDNYIYVADDEAGLIIISIPN